MEVTTKLKGMECLLGLDCEWNSCPNKRTCAIWTMAWPLPYYYSQPERSLIVFCKEAYKELCEYGFEDFNANPRPDWKKAGFADAEFLPYEAVPGKLWVNWGIQHYGFARAIVLPYLYNLEDGVPVLQVRHVLPAEAKAAGYHGAMSLDLYSLPAL